MEEKTKDNMLEVLNLVLQAIRRNDIKALNDLSNMTIHTASVVQDQISISLAVIIYSLAKIIERTTDERYKDCSEFCKESTLNLEKAYYELEHGNYDSLEETLKQNIELIEKLDKKIRQYIQEVLLKARITKGSRLYEHGISLERTAYLLGISQYALMDYTGKTHIADVRMKVLILPKERMKIARSLFQ